MEIQNVKGVEIARVETVSACFLILVPSISTNKQTKTYLSLLLILKPINGSLLPLYTVQTSEQGI